MAERLNEMLARLESAFAARQRFMADASHELRTPVAALVIALEVSLRHPRDAEAYRRTLETCLTDARQLRLLVERLMEQVRSENLSHDEPAQDLDVTALLHQCADALVPLMELRGVRLERDVPAGLRASLAPGRLRSVITNLLSNAAEYNRRGGRVELVGSQVAGALTLRIADTGVGIAAEHLPHLFDPFYRADRSRQHEVDESGAVGSQHLGLGLSLVRAHLQAMNGTVAVESQPGQGSVFTVTLPGQRAASGPALAGAGARDNPANESPRQKPVSHAGLIEAG